MGDLIVIASALFGALVIAAGIGWFVPRMRQRFAGQRTGTAAGPLPGVGLIVAGLLVLALSLGVFTDGPDASAGDVAATCDLLEGGEDDISVESLDALLAVAPPDIAVHVRTPVANSLAERWIGTLRRELLDRTIIWNQRQLCRRDDGLQHHQTPPLRRPHQRVQGCRMTHDRVSGTHRPSRSSAWTASAGGAGPGTSSTTPSCTP